MGIFIICVILPVGLYLIGRLLGKQASKKTTSKSSTTRAPASKSSTTTQSKSDFRKNNARINYEPKSSVDAFALRNRGLISKAKYDSYNKKHKADD